MSRRRLQSCLVWWVAVSTSIGCHPIQPSYFFEDGDLSHYLDVATEIEYPDEHSEPLREASGSHEPLTLENFDSFEMWDLTLEQCIQIALANSQVIRRIDGPVQGAPTTITRVGQNLSTIYDPALVESSYGVATGSPLSGAEGVEAALSEFDTQFASSFFWEETDTPQNAVTINAPVLVEDRGNFTASLQKTTVTGATLTFQNDTNYLVSNRPFRVLNSDWTTTFQASFSQPLLQGRGTQYNRIAGPLTFAQFNANIPNPIDGVMIARLRTDQTLSDFEVAVRDLVEDLETAYYELYFTYRNLEAQKAGRDSAQESWRNAKVREEVGEGPAANEAQARAQYFLFRSQVETAQSQLFEVEANLRQLMGLAAADGRLIRPIDEPTTARVAFQWNSILPEALVRRAEVRRQKWEVKKRELELIAAKNHLLPRLDAVGNYRWLGLGDDLLNAQRQGLPPTAINSNAFETLTGGRFQEWQLGLQFSLPIGFRRALSGVRHQELLLTREKALLDEIELEISHQLDRAIKDLVRNYQLAQTNFNRRVAAEKEVEAVTESVRVGTVTLDVLLDAQRRRADAEVAYHRSLVDYNLSIMRVYLYKGALLDYNGVYLAEGPWPKKAYFDAVSQARKRDGAKFLNYGFTRPRVISRGPHAQTRKDEHRQNIELEPVPAEDLDVEEIPVPDQTEPGAPMPEPEPEPTVRRRSTRGPNLQQPQLVSPAAHQQTAIDNRGASDPAARTSQAARIPATWRQSSGVPARKRGTLPVTDRIPTSNRDTSSDEAFSRNATTGSSATASGWTRSQRSVPGTGLRR